MGLLGISTEAFYDMSPREFYYATKSVGDFRRAQSQHQYEVARYQAFTIINLTSTILKDRFKDPRELGRFVWEPEIDEVQSVDTLKQNAMIMARALGSVVVDKGPDDPPRVLARKFRK